MVFFVAYGKMFAGVLSGEQTNVYNEDEYRVAINFNFAYVVCTRKVCSFCVHCGILTRILYEYIINIKFSTIGKYELTDLKDI